MCEVVSLTKRAAVALYRSGFSFREVSRVTGCSTFTVRKALHDAGEASRPFRGKVEKLTAEKAAELYQAGKTLKEIADAHGLSTYAVNDRLKKMGIERRRRGPKASNED